MSQKSLSNIPASIKGRLLQLSKQRREDFNYLSTRYAADRLLYRRASISLQGSVHFKGSKFVPSMEW